MLYFLPPINPITERLSEYCYWLCAECSIVFAMTRYQGQITLVAKERRQAQPPLQLLMSGRWDRT
jgi:hypothetical protein